MTLQEQTLWQKIQEFQIDEPGVSFNFSTRLARENGWSKKYALRVIEEYKRFIFLCCISKTGITPADAVDQAWHLHLTFTKSYWIDFCRETLQKEVHHNPTKGGQSEATKFDDYYSSTKNIYRQKFGQLPPSDIWPDNDTRFSDIDFQRVNLKSYWLLRKPRYTRTLALLTFLVLSGVLLIQASGTDSSFIVSMIFGAIVLFIVGRAIINNNKNGGGCSSPSGYGVDSSHSSHGDSGCGSGCSGCSSSGCSGCGSGGS